MNSTSDRDELYYLKTIKLLCARNIRSPLTIEQTKTWLNQFKRGPEKDLALLILRYLIYRTSDQLQSSLKQALKSAAVHFNPLDPNVVIDWREILNGPQTGLTFNYGPLKQDATRPGKSGEVITRMLRNCIPLDTEQLVYPDQITKLESNQRYLLVDDGAFTGTQFITFLNNEGSYMAKTGRAAIVLGFAHEEAIARISKAFPDMPVFCGEKITAKESFKTLCEEWVSDKLWSHKIHPIEQYMAIVESQSSFQTNNPLGFGDLGCMIAYAHGVPDNSLQLLWDKSESWKPLFER